MLLHVQHFPCSPTTCITGLAVHCTSIERPIMPRHGMLLQVNMDVECWFVQDMLKGAECYELRLRLKEHRDESFPFKDDE